MEGQSTGAAVDGSYGGGIVYLALFWYLFPHENS